jgi:hypothetical protein
MGLLGALAGDDAAIVAAIVGVRLVVPLFIPRFPLVIVAAMLVDAVDQTLLAALTEINTGETGPYQSYDKALDVYYLTVAYLSTMRNWASVGAFRVSQFLFFYRLVGVTLFELSESRVLLVVFPNTFEYFFIAYEVVRLRWDPTRIAARGWVLIAAAIWVCVKLPQEYWIHVAERDLTDAIGAHPAAAVAVGVLAAGAAVTALVYFRPRFPAPDWPPAFAADSVAPDLGTPDARYRSRLGRSVLSVQLLEQAALLSLVCVIFAEILPGGNASPPEMAVGVSAIVLANTFVSVWVARRGGIAFRSGAILYVLRLVLNVALVATAGALATDRGAVPFGHGIFFAQLITLVTWLYDWYRPLYEARFRRLGNSRSS